MPKRRFGAEEAYVALWKIAYVMLRGILRVLIGRRRRQDVQYRLGLHFQRAENVRYGSLSFRHEPYVRKILKSKLRKGSTYLDVGSGIGIHVSYASKLVGMDGKIIALEPDPTNFEILSASNWEHQNVTLMNEALWVEDGETLFSKGNIAYNQNSKPTSYTGTITPLPEHISSGFISDTQLKVSTIRVDTLMERLGQLNVDVAKIDIEGSEYDLFADSTLDLSRFENLIIEMHGEYPNERTKKLMTSLQLKGFTLTLLTTKETRNVQVLAERLEKAKK